MLYHVTAPTPRGSLGVDVAHLVVRGLRRGYGPAQILHLLVGAKIVPVLDQHLKYANVTLPTAEQSHLEKQQELRALQVRCKSF
jgi:hypothetical protein